MNRSQRSAQAMAAELIKCVNSSASLTTPIEDDSIVYAMFASPEVYTYAAHTALVNGAFFEHGRYAARLLSHETGDDFHPKDRRWNKIRAVVRAFTDDEGGGWAKNTRALAFIDTDLLILDWTLDVAEVLDGHPDADVILSADALDVGNTGFLIIRNTAWALSFFQEWWDSRYMKHTFCDQHVLNKLIEGLRLKQRSHKVHVLPNNAINSRWPALETMDETDRVLHLMGETTPFRAAVGAHASSVVCAAYGLYSTDIKGRGSEASHPDLPLLFREYIPAQYDFSQERLIALARHALRHEREERYQGASSPLASEGDFDHLHAAISNSCDDKRPYLSSNHSECEGFFHEEYLLLRKALEACTSSRPHQPAVDPAQKEVVLEEVLEFTNRTSDYKLFLLDHMAKTLYDMVFFAPHERKRDAAERVMNALEGMKSHVDMNRAVNQIYLEHKKALIHAQLSSYYFSEHQWDASLRDGVVAINALGQVLGLSEEANPDFPGYVLEYVNCASRAAETFIRLERFGEALEWAQTALQNAQVLYATYRGEERVIAQDLARLHAIVAEAHIYHEEEGHLRKAADELALATMSKLSRDTENQLPRKMRARLANLQAVIQAKARGE